MKFSGGLLDGDDFHTELLCASGEMV